MANIRFAIKSPLSLSSRRGGLYVLHVAHTNKSKRVPSRAEITFKKRNPDIITSERYLGVSHYI